MKTVLVTEGLERLSLLVEQSKATRTSLARSEKRYALLSPERFRFLFVLVLAFGVRLINIQSPLLDFHSWRQTTTAMMARNLVFNGYNLFYPQVDYFGPQAASLESEFPLYPFIVSLFYGAFGVQEWLARLVAVLFSVGSTWLLYSLVKRYMGAGPAFFAGVYFSLSPFSIFFGRAVMPEPLMLFLSIAAIWAFSRWTDTGRNGFYILSMAAAVLASMVKLPSLYIVVPVGFLFLSSAPSRNKSIIRAFVDWRIWLWGIVAVVTPFLWYLHAANVGAESGASLGLLSSGGGDRLGTLDMWLSPDFYRVFFYWFVVDIATWGALPLFLIGIVWPPKRGEFVLYVLLLAMIVYVFGVANGMVSQEYYIYPVAMVMAIFAGKGASRLLGAALAFRPLLLIVIPLIVGSIIASAYFSYERLIPLYKTTDVFLEAAKATAEVTKSGTPTIAVHYGEPEILYYADRKGWHLFPNELTPEKVEELRGKGAKALVLAEQAGLAGKAPVVEILKKYAIIGMADSSLVVSLDPDLNPRYKEASVAKSFGNRIELLGAKVDKQVAPGGESIPVSLKLWTKEALDDDYRLSLRLVGEGGYIGGQIDGVPANGYFPTHLWQRGQVIDDLYTLPVLPGAIPGQYNLELRIYRNRDLALLPVDGENTKRVVLGQINVLPSFKAAVPAQWEKVEKQFGSDLYLLGVQAPVGPFKPGDYVRVSSLWQAKSASPQGYRALFRLVSADGGVISAEPLDLSPSYPSSTWENGEVLSLEHLVRVPASAKAGEYKLSLGLVRETEAIGFASGWWPFQQKGQFVDVKAIRIEDKERRFDIPEVLNSTNEKLGDSIELVGYRYEGNTAGKWKPGERIQLTLVWRAIAESGRSYKVFTHMLRNGTEVVAQTDSIPQAGAAPTSGWIEGEVIIDSYDIMVPAQLAGGVYDVEIGMYDPVSGERLKTPQGDDRMLLNPVEVVEK